MAGSKKGYYSGPVFQMQRIWSLRRPTVLTSASGGYCGSSIAGATTYSTEAYKGNPEAANYYPKQVAAVLPIAEYSTNPVMLAQNAMAAQQPRIEQGESSKQASHRPTGIRKKGKQKEAWSFKPPRIHVVVCEK